jgi:hypothetical protein
VFSGGSLDDRLEPYDDLLAIGTIEVIAGREAELLAGGFIDRPVLAAVWHEPDLQTQCGTRAVISVGLDQDEFRTILSGLTTRQPVRASN